MINSKAILLILVLAFYPRHFFAQNLVPNPSFEVLDSCPDNQNQLYKAKYWFNPNQFTSPDLFSSCSNNSDISTPHNLFGYQEPKSDSSYALISVIRKTNNFSHEYLSVRLLDSLDKDSIYCVSFFISPIIDPSSELFTDGVGAFLSKDSVFQTTNTYLDLPGQIRMEGVMYDDSSTWSEISGFYTALGGEKFITIGGFWEFSEVSSIGSGDGSIIYVDDVSVTKCAVPPAPTDTTSATNFISVYPNPNRGQFTLDYGVISNVSAMFQLFDSSGKLIYKKSNLTGKFEEEITIPYISAGIYIWRFDVNGESIETGKMIITE